MKTKWFRRSRQILLKYGPGPLIAGFIFWGFVILYKEGNWPAFSALATLVLALAAVLTIRDSNEREKRRRKEELAKEKRDKEEKLLNEITKWSADVLKHCSSLAHGFNNEMERSEARDKYLTLKFACENLIISVENETFGSDLLNQLQCANNCFDGVSFNSLQDNKNKRTNLELFCRNIREVAFKLLKNR